MTAFNLGVGVELLNVIKFVTLTLFLVPLMEAAYGRFLGREAAEVMVEGGVTSWEELPMGSLMLHGKYRDSTTKKRAIVMAVLVNAMLLSAEFGFGASEVMVPAPVLDSRWTEAKLVNFGSYSCVENGEGSGQYRIGRSWFAWTVIRRNEIMTLTKCETMANLLSEDSIDVVRIAQSALANNDIVKEGRFAINPGSTGHRKYSCERSGKQFKTREEFEISEVEYLRSGIYDQGGTERIHRKAVRGRITVTYPLNVHCNLGGTYIRYNDVRDMADLNMSFSEIGKGFLKGKDVNGMECLSGPRTEGTLCYTEVDRGIIRIYRPMRVKEMGRERHRSLSYIREIMRVSSSTSVTGRTLLRYIVLMNAVPKVWENYGMEMFQREVSFTNSVIGLLTRMGKIPVEKRVVDKNSVMPRVRASISVLGIASVVALLLMTLTLIMGGILCRKMLIARLEGRVSEETIDKISLLGMSHRSVIDQWDSDLGNRGDCLSPRRSTKGLAIVSTSDDFTYHVTIAEKGDVIKSDNIRGRKPESDIRFKESMIKRLLTRGLLVVTQETMDFVFDYEFPEECTEVN